MPIKVHPHSVRESIRYLPSSADLATGAQYTLTHTNCSAEQCNGLYTYPCINCNDRLVIKFGKLTLNKTEIKVKWNSQSLMVTDQNQHESHIIATYDMFSGDVIDMVSRRRK